MSLYKTKQAFSFSPKYPQLIPAGTVIELNELEASDLVYAGLIEKHKPTVKTKPNENKKGK
jgi:hypothetical protein